MASDNNFIPHLHAFRGFAIISIVAAHCWSFMIFWTGDLSSDGIKNLFWFTETLFHGSTIYFAVISGLLFSLVLQKYTWPQFYKSKLLNVLLPYTLVTLTLTAYYWQYFVQNPEINDTAIDFTKTVALNLFSGGGAIHFWYIPLLAVMFFLTPLFVWLQARFKLGIAVLILAPLIISRSPFPDFLQPQSFVYFIGAYVFGMTLATNYQQTLKWFEQYSALLMLTLVVSSIGVFLTYLYNYQPSGIYSLRQMLVYIQKLSICFLTLHYFSKFETRLPAWLSTLGTYSFAIFFLHVVFIDVVIQTVRSSLEENRVVELVALYGGMNLLAGILGSVLLAKVIKQLLGKYARNVIGV